MNLKTLLLSSLCFCYISAMAQVTLEQGTGKSNFSIVGADSKAVICFDNEDAIVVRKSVDLFVDDVCRVTGHTLKVFGTHPDKVLLVMPLLWVPLERVNGLKSWLQITRLIQRQLPEDGNGI